MRDHGTRAELIRLRPHDHIGWVFSGPGQFAALAAPYLAEGAELGELLMFVVDDPNREAYLDLAAAFDATHLQVASISEVYGGSGHVDAAAQRATFAAVMAEALSQGYSGIRVAADNSSLVTDPERLESWIRWELVADEFMSANHVTGLCAFDKTKVAVETLRHLATLHPLSSADEGVPQFRLFVDDGALTVEGDLDVFAVEHLELALSCLPRRTRVVVDMARASLRGDGVRDRLRRLADTGVPVTILHVAQPA